MSKLPHWLFPSFWGLKGKAKERALAEYYIEPSEELDITLLNIDYEPETREYKERKLSILKKYDKISDIDFDLDMLNLNHYNHETKEYKADKLKLLLKHNAINQEEYEFGMLDLLDTNSYEFKKLTLEAKLKYKSINEQEYKRELATLNEEEYFEILKGEWDPEMGMVFEFDWNSVFVDNLRKNGFRGETDSDLVNAWFDDVCRQVYYDSIGEEDEQPEAILANNGYIGRNELGNGFTEYN